MPTDTGYFVYSIGVLSGNTNAFGPLQKDVTISTSDSVGLTLGDGAAAETLSTVPANTVPGPLTYLGTATANGAQGFYVSGFGGLQYFFAKTDPGPGQPVTRTPDTAGPGGADFTFCFYPGTLLRTPGGEVPVEALRAGDPVLTHDGRTVPVRFMFRQTVAALFAEPVRDLPIRIRAGALAEGLPARDLLVSPAHALLLGGVLVQAGALVNGASILREAEVPSTFTWWHVELGSHDLVLAEGVPAETFVDNVDREAFDNWDEYQALSGETAPVAEMRLPRAKSARQVPAAIRAAIAARAAVLSPVAADAA